MFNSMLRTYSINYHNKLKKFVRPLEDHLSVKHFCYYSIDNNGQYHFMGTHLPFTEYFYDQKLYLNCPYLLHPSNYQSGISFTKGIDNPEFQKSQEQVREIFDINIALTFFEKNESSVQGFCFATNIRETHLETLYCNELPIFKRFIEGFKKEFHSIIRKISQDAINISKLESHCFYKQQNDLVAKVKNREALLKKMGVTVPFHLTNGERQIAQMIAQGYTAKEIGLLLNKSKRTIECYTLRLKEILFCSSKSELVIRTQELSNLGYFQ